MASKLCVAFSKSSRYEEFLILNMAEVEEIMAMFDTMIPNAAKNTIVDSETEVFHERWIGERFSIVFCMTEVFGRSLTRRYLSSCTFTHKKTYVYLHTHNKKYISHTASRTGSAWRLAASSFAHGCTTACLALDRMCP